MRGACVPQHPEFPLTDSIAAIGHAGHAVQAARAAGVDASLALTNASGAASVSVAPILPGESLLARVQAGLEQARVLGADAERATAMVRSGASCDVEGVLLATRKADAAFQMLQAVRNAMLEAYAQVRDMRG